MITDTERLDFLSKLTMTNGGHITIEREYDPLVGSPTYGYQDRIKFFTILTQWITSPNLRNAIDYAMNLEKKR